MPTARVGLPYPQRSSKGDEDDQRHDDSGIQCWGAHFLGTLLIFWAAERPECTSPTETIQDNKRRPAIVLSVSFYLATNPLAR
jgi:hypothetical protein